MPFELNNDQRKYLGLAPVDAAWDRVIFKGDFYRKESILYYDGDVIKRHIESNDESYKESQYDEMTSMQTTLLAKTAKGKDQKLTAATLEKRSPIGVYCCISTDGHLRIGNYTTQTTFYDNRDDVQGLDMMCSFNDIIGEFIRLSPDNHLGEIADFKNRKRKNVTYKAGDFFAFKLNRTEFGFGRVLVDIVSLKKKATLPHYHEFRSLMGKSLLVKIYGYVSKSKNADIDELATAMVLPSDYMMDNVLFYGEYEIAGHRALKESDMDFPMSYGKWEQRGQKRIYLQWGMIYKEIIDPVFDKYLVADNLNVSESSPSRKIDNPYSYRSIGFRPAYNGAYAKGFIENNGVFDFEKCKHYKSNFDLRNPRNTEVRRELMLLFGLDPDKSYDENCELTGTMRVKELLKLIN